MVRFDSEGNSPWTLANARPADQKSRAAHAQKKALARERKFAKPHADDIHRAKKLWERLRIKSSVPKEERTGLVDELYGIITGRVYEFVFKHDSVRTIQCALKYANPAQRKAIAKELKGQYKILAESKYGKFLVAKVLTTGDDEVREMIISEFYGHVRRLINHPEAAWILDDTYRGIATTPQKMLMLREWYGPEFSIFKSNAGSGKASTSDLSTILSENPEKKRPILNDLHQLINQLVQKKTTGFTMLHDAMLQYSLAIGTPSAENTTASEFLELLKSDLDTDADLLKNLAFTTSGSRILCRALATSNAKDRKVMLRVYKEHVEMLACDPNGIHVLLTAYEVVDDTVMLEKVVFPQLLASKTTNEGEKFDAIMTMVTHPVGRLALLYPLAASADGPPKWLIRPESPTTKLLNEVKELRVNTSKKEPQKRLCELAKSLITESDGLVLKFIADRASSLLRDIFGCQFIGEVLFESDGGSSEKLAAASAIAACAAGDLNDDDHVSKIPSACRTLKALALGGKYDREKQALVRAEPPLRFAGLLWKAVKEDLVEWATGDGSFVIVGLAEADGDEFGKGEKSEIKPALKSVANKVQEAAKNGNKGANLLMEKM